MKYEESQEFLKEGMKVKVVKGRYSSFDRYNGKEFSICSINFDHEIAFDCEDGPLIYKDTDEFEILTEADGMTPWKDPRVEKLPFEIGQRVTGQRMGMEFTGKFRGQCTYYESDWAIERDDGKQGGAQNGWWSVEKHCPITAVEDQGHKPIETAQFQIGDLVSCGYEGRKMQGVITDVKSDRITVNTRESPAWACHKRGDGTWAGAYGCDDGVTNLVKLPEENPEAKFKVGDRIKVIGYQFNPDFVGKMGIVTDVLEKEVEVTLDGETGFWRSLPENIEKVSEEESKFKIGDRVKSLYSSTSGETGIIVGKSKSRGSWIVKGFSYGVEAEGGHSYSEKYMEKVEEETNQLITFNGEGVTTPTPKKGFMSTIVQKIKDLALSETDRILRKYGLEDESRKKTETASEMMKNEMEDERWATRREDIASKLKQIDEQEKK